MTFASRQPDSRQPAPRRRTTRRRPLPHVVEENEQPTAEMRAVQAAKADAAERHILVRRLRLLAISFGLFVVIVLAQMVSSDNQLHEQPNQVSAQAVDTSRGGCGPGRYAARHRRIYLGDLSRPQPLQSQEIHSEMLTQAAEN